MNDITLSIVIPTKNRGSFLRETLECILRDLEEEIEIVIVDGGSTDGTDSVVMEFKSQYEFINYIRIIDLLGFDAELDLGVTSSKGHYVWVFSDDDIIQGRDINHIVRHLNSSLDIELLLVNSCIWNKDLRINLQSKFVSKPDMTSNNMNLLFDNFIDYLSFIGGCIIKKEKWITVEVSKYFGTLFVHVGVIFSHKSLNWQWLERPIVKIRYGNASWSAKAQEIWLKKWPNLLMSFETVSQILRDKKVKISSFSAFKKLVFFKAVNCYNPQVLGTVDQVKNQSMYRVIVYIVNMLPKLMCYQMAYLFASLTNKSIMIADLKSARK